MFRFVFLIFSIVSVKASDKKEISKAPVYIASPANSKAKLKKQYNIKPEPKIDAPLPEATKKAETSKVQDSVEKTTNEDPEE